jgi:transcription antitermination factor NusG
MPVGFAGMGGPIEEPIFKPLERGLKVLILQTPYFGVTGHVLQVSSDNSRVVIKLSMTGETIEVSVPNLLAL